MFTVLSSRHTVVIARVHPVQAMNARQLTTSGPSRPTWAISLPVTCPITHRFSKIGENPSSTVQGILLTMFGTNSHMIQAGRRLDLRAYAKFRWNGNKGRPHNILYCSIESAIPENPLVGPNISGLSAVQAELWEIFCQILWSKFWALGGLNQNVEEQHFVESHMEKWRPKCGLIPSSNKKEESIWSLSMTNRQTYIQTDRQSQRQKIIDS